MKGGNNIFTTTKFHPHPLYSSNPTTNPSSTPPSSPPLALPDPNATASPSPKKPKKSPPPSADGSSIEVARRPRGRPPGSKNKPKPIPIITRESTDSPNLMRPHILEIPTGHDVADALTRFSRRRDLALSVLAGTGPVSNVTLSSPSPSPSTFTFHGRFEILSISATIFPPSFSSIPSSGGGFSVSLAGPHGQIVGGAVAGPLIAAGTVTIVAAAFGNPSFHRLPADDDLAVSVSVSMSGEGEQSHHSQPNQQMPMASCNLLSDVIWAPPARPPY